MKYRILFILIIIFFPVLNANSQIEEGILKAAFIEKFTKLINWPEKTTQNDKFTICVVGNKSFYDQLHKAYSKRELKGKEVVVLFNEKIPVNQEIDILYLGVESNKLLDDAVEHLKNCLIVSEYEGFAKKGAHINFYLTEKETMHFEINKSSMDDSGFKMDFLLLDFAKVVNK
ncbi:MAG: YfiR family protein [Bacteroidales bacterium]|nr:YfiR family protein [Bacteroidales bacterium]MBN2820329.1 YfiR family protein [Bacteroidales bacterium]